SGVPASSSITSSTLCPPRTPPRALTSSAPIFAPRTMNCPALASPGGDRGVRTPIFTGVWAGASPASPPITSTTTSHIPIHLRMASSLSSQARGRRGSLSPVCPHSPFPEALPPGHPVDQTILLRLAAAAGVAPAVAPHGSDRLVAPPHRLARCPSR